MMAESNGQLRKDTANERILDEDSDGRRDAMDADSQVRSENAVVNDYVEGVGGPNAEV